MRINSSQFVNNLQKQGMPPLTVLLGDAPLLVIEAADALRAQAKSAGYVVREVLTAQQGFDWQQFVLATQSQSLFGDRKLIDLRIPNGKPGKVGGKILQGIAAPAKGQALPDVITMITLPQLDWKDQKAVWFTHLQQVATVVEANAPQAAELPGWIAGRLRQQQQHTSDDVLRYMATRFEGNLLAAFQEIQKLALLYPAGALTAAQIQDAIHDVARYTLDDLRGAILQNDLSRILRSLQSLEDEGETPILVLWAFSEEIRTLLLLHAGLAERQPIDTLARTYWIRGPRLALIKKLLQKLPASFLNQALAECSRIDRMVKGLVDGDVWLSFRRLALLMCAT